MRATLLCVLVASCVTAPRMVSPSSPAAAQALPAAGEKCHTGIVGTRFADPFVLPVLRLSPRPLNLSGSFAARIAQLTGALVTVCGDADPGLEVSGSAGPGVPFAVRSFELRQVEGLDGYLGRVTGAAGGLALELGGGRPAVALAGAPAALFEHLGDEAWVSGSWSSDGFVVSAFGVLTPAPSR